MPEYIRDWITYEPEWHEWDTRANPWHNTVADTINSLIDSTTITVGDFGTLPSSIANFGGAYRELYVQRVGNMVTLGGLIQNVSGAPITAGTDVFTIPSGFRPVSDGILVPALVTGATASRVRIKTDGNVHLVDISWPNNATWSLEGITYYTE